MAITEQERDIIRQVLAFDEDEPTFMLDSAITNPVSNYADPEQLNEEIDVLFRNFPLALAHRSDVAEPGDFVTHDDTGVPILITRSDDGEVKAYLNVCRHRGARVAGEPCGHARRFTCPYHAWTYDLDGALRGMPQPAHFGTIDRSELSLVELPAFERYGLIWVVPSPRSEPMDLDTWFAPMDEQLSRLDLGNHTVFKTWELHRNMSWRIALEGFQESYHFCSAHRDSACSNYLDNQSVWNDFGAHVRHSVPLPKTLELRDQPESDWEFRTTFMDQNYLFPANFVQVMTDHVYVHTIIPTGVGTCVFRCTMLVPEAPTTEKAERYWEANYNVVRVVFDEDFTIGEGIQKGLGTGANEQFVFGRYECGLHYGQRAIDAALAGDLAI